MNKTRTSAVNMLRRHCLTAAAIALTTSGLVNTAVAEDATVIELTQVNCQFVESEHGKNHGFASTEKKDCEAIHEQSGDERKR